MDGRYMDLQMDGWMIQDGCLDQRNGKYIWIYDSTKIIYNDKNEVSYYLGYIVDVSKEKQREQYLQQQTKMVALGEMIGNIAHQWRQPLSMISTSITSFF